MYLAIRARLRRTKGNGPDNEVGDVIAAFPDDYLSSGKDFGREAASAFRWVHVPGMTEEDLLDEFAAGRFVTEELSYGASFFGDGDGLGEGGRVV